MINKEVIYKIIPDYKQYLLENFKREKFKWEAVKCFQDNWNIDAENLNEMLSKALDKTGALLNSANYYAHGMILAFAEEAEVETRKLFRYLFDESKDLEERIIYFQNGIEDIRQTYGSEKWNNHYHGLNAITTYLWLKYPDKYYIYKYSAVREMAKIVQSDFVPLKRNLTKNVVDAYKMYDIIRDILNEDQELKSTFKNLLTDECYQDKHLNTLTIDFVFFVSKYYNNADWYPYDYSPKISVDEWLKLLNDKDIFTEDSLKIVKRINEYGGQATCKQLAIKYGSSNNFYNSGSVALAKRIHKKTNCPLYTKDTNAKWWPILYTGKNSDNGNDGTYIWKLRDELSKALKNVDLSNVDLYENNTTKQNVNYWWMNCNPKIWSFSDINVGDIHEYTLYNESGNKRRIFQNFLDTKVGDIIIGYESNPVKQIVALAKIAKDRDDKQIYFEKVESLETPIDYATLKNCQELEKMEYFVNPQGSLFKLSNGEYEFIMDLIRENNPVSNESNIDSYSKNDFFNEVFMDESEYDSLVSLLKNKLNIILQGAPGVGKTHTAKRLAYSIMGQKDDSRIEMIQFHQNYTYEDFVMGYKPDENGFKLTTGVFYKFCQKAANNPNKEYFFIIDEINRGNLSKIFGELLMLIEKGYRTQKITLSYNGLPFTVPKNIYIIGMMNTADRSLALIDYALRRRFSFYNMQPKFDNEGFIKYQKSLNNETFDMLIEYIKEINKEIIKDDALGEGFCIGHSYFCNQSECTDEWLKSVVLFDIIPLIKEYWFDDLSKVHKWENSLIGVFND